MALEEPNEAAIFQQMFGTASDNDDEEQAFEDDEEEKYPSSSSIHHQSNENNDVYETEGHQFKGLKNQGATCYLNALLQSLYFTPELREGIYNLSPQDLGIDHIEEADKLDADIVKYKLRDEDIAMLTSLGYTTARAKRALVKAENNYDVAKVLLETNGVPSVKRILIKLREFFSLLSISHGDSSVSTKELTDAFGWVSREVRVQHDAHELNRILIDAIERSLKGTKNESLINSIYLGQMVSRTLCLKCEYCSERKENFLDAIVQVQNLNNLHESLSNQCKSEYLVGDNKYFCEKCNAKCDAKRSVAYTKLPNVLTLALNRFVFNLYTMNREKCTTTFGFPLIFDFEPFLDCKLSSQQTHRTKEDEELLKAANDEYIKEKKRKEHIQERKKKDEVESKINNMSKQPLAIEAPPGVMDTQITKGTHMDVAPLPQSTTTNNDNNNNNNNVTQWRRQIPRSRSQEDEDVKRAIAESLGQVYVAPKTQERTMPQSYNMNTNMNMHHLNMNMNMHEEPFEAQESVTYQDAIDILVDGTCCFGLYDKKVKQWRTAVFMKKWDDKERLMVRFTQDNNNLNPSSSSDKFLTIKEFPVDYIIDDVERFDVKERDLRDMSNVAKDKIDAWAQRKKVYEKNKHKNKKKKDDKSKKEREEKERKDKEERLKKEKQDKERLKKEEDERLKKEKEDELKKEKEEKERKEKEEKEKMKKIEDTKEDKEDKDKDEEKKEEEVETPQDWSKRTDFSGVSLVGYLCNDGEVIQGDCLRQKPGKIFVHFNTDAGHFGKKYDWITIPNERLCPPPKTRPKQRNMPFSREMTTFSSHMYPMSTTDYGSRDEATTIGASPWNRNKNNYNNRNRHYPQWKLTEPDININSNHLYALTGVVIHRGTPHAGHYHAYLKDFMKEGKYQKKDHKNKDKQDKDKDKGDDKKEEEKQEKEDKKQEDETHKFIKKICDDALWYDFNDSSVYRIPARQLAKQYGGGASYDECAYMLVYRKINKDVVKEVMHEPNLTLPQDLVSYVDKINAQYEEERKKQEAKQNEIKMQIVNPSCFTVNKDGKLTMNPFIESLLKKIIRLSREKANIDRVINKNNNTNGESENSENKNETDDNDEEEINKLYLEKKWPTNMKSKEIHNIVQEHYKQNSIFVTCDGRDSIDKLMNVLDDKFESMKGNIKLHFLSIPSVFDCDDIECKSIDNLFDSNIGGNVDDRLYPIRAFGDDDDKNNDIDDDEYPYHFKPDKIRHLPFKHLDFMLHSRTCFVWNGVDINGVSFNLESARTIDIRIKYLTDNTQSFVEDVVTVPMRASLDEIWSKIGKDLKIDSLIKLPVFTLLSTSSRDWPDIIYFGSDLHVGVSKYDAEFYSAPKFAQLLHHKINPMKRWRSNKYSSRRVRSNSSPVHINHDRLYAANYNSDHHEYHASDSVWGSPILCIENALNLPQPHHDTMASQEWQESTKFSNIIVEDYTSNSEEKEEKEYKYCVEDIGSSNCGVSCRKLRWKIPKGTSLERFFEIARSRCNIPSDVDLRAFRIYDSERFLITFPHKFQLKEHRLMLERGRYPKYNEVFLMVSIIPSSSFLPLIVDRSKSVKYIKQQILKLFNLNGVNYKKYVCYNITSDKYICWRDSQTLNTPTLNPRHGDRIGIQIGVDVIHKSVVIMSDTRNLDKIEFNSSIINNDNPYIKQELGTLSIEGDSTLQSLRQQIYEQHLNHVKSSKHLLLSWYDTLYHIPLSFPMLKSGKLQNQKNFNSQRSVICVEIVNQEIQEIPKNSRFLHIHLAKIEENTISFWPNDHHIRIIYKQKEDSIISYKHLSQFISKKYNILTQNLLITMFKINKGEWLIIDDSTDDLTKTPFCITKTNRHGQIFAIFDLEEKENKMKEIKENIKQWPVPPLSNKARFHFKHFNNQHSSINDISKSLQKSNHYDRQLKITNID